MLASGRASSPALDAAQVLLAAAASPAATKKRLEEIAARDAEASEKMDRLTGLRTALEKREKAVSAAESNLVLSQRRAEALKEALAREKAEFVAEKQRESAALEALKASLTEKEREVARREAEVGSAEVGLVSRERDCAIKEAELARKSDDFRQRVERVRVAVQEVA